MVRDNATLITYGDITPLIPAAAIALLTIAVNFVVDWFLHKTSGLRDMRVRQKHNWVLLIWEANYQLYVLISTTF